MKHPKQNWNGDFLRVDFDAEDVDILEGAVERLERLANIEDELGVVAVPSPFILGRDVPTITRDALVLLKKAIQPWMPPEDGVLVYESSPEEKS